MLDIEERKKQREEKRKNQELKRQLIIDQDPARKGWHFYSHREIKEKQ
jgi:hypothetical protein